MCGVCSVFLFQVVCQNVVLQSLQNLGCRSALLREREGGGGEGGGGWCGSGLTYLTYKIRHFNFLDGSQFCQCKCAASYLDNNTMWILSRSQSPTGEILGESRQSGWPTLMCTVAKLIFLDKIKHSSLP